ncbi:hypothetical protein B0H16DRAFT_1781939, partial [Mycena metata]
AVDLASTCQKPICRWSSRGSPFQPRTPLSHRCGAPGGNAAAAVRSESPYSAHALTAAFSLSHLPIPILSPRSPAVPIAHRTPPRLVPLRRPRCRRSPHPPLGANAVSVQTSLPPSFTSPHNAHTESRAPGTAPGVVCAHSHRTRCERSVRADIAAARSSCASRPCARGPSSRGARNTYRIDPAAHSRAAPLHAHPLLSPPVVVGDYASTTARRVPLWPCLAVASVD